MLVLSSEHRTSIIAACIRALPHEGCGLLLGTASGVVSEVVLSDNIAQSARVYEIDPRVLLRAYRRAEELGDEVIGVFHSHTHSQAFPSPTDIAQAPDPSWHYVLVSLRDTRADVRSFSIVEAVVSEEDIEGV